MKSAPMNSRNVHSSIVGNHEAVGVQRVDPDIVIVSPPRDFLKRFAAVQGFQKAAVGNIHFVVVSCGDSDSNVVPGASD